MRFITFYIIVRNISNTIGGNLMFSESGGFKCGDMGKTCAQYEILPM